VRLGVMTGFHSRDLRTDPRTVREADTAWVNPITGAPLGAVIRALCDRDFRRPFDGKVKIAAARPAPTPKSAPAPKTAPPVVVASAPEAETPKPPALRSTVAPASPPPAKPKTAAAATAVPGIAVQIGASPDLADAQGLIARFKKKFADDLSGHPTDVVTAEVDGKTVHRALITGFASASEATSLCKKLTAAGQACFVRH
jgi:hypothetical protein